MRPIQLSRHARLERMSLLSSQHRETMLNWIRENPLLVWSLVFLLLGEGLVLPLRVSGQIYLLPVAPFVTPVMVVMEWQRRGRPRLGVGSLPLLYAVSFFVALGALLPFAGVLTGSSPRYLAAVTQPLSVASWVVVGILLGGGPSRPHSKLTTPITIAATVQLLAGVLQLLGRVVHVREMVWLWGHWLEYAYGARLLSRASGLYLNPNTYALFGVLSLVWAIYAPLSRQRRLALATVSLAMIALSQSRTSLIIAVAVMGIAVLQRSMRLSVIFSDRRRTIFVLGALASVLLVMGVAGLAPMFAERLVTAARVLREGPAADANLSARLGGWADAARVLKGSPMGTLIPPHARIRVVDSDYLRVLAQGSVVYLISYLALLVLALKTARRSGDRTVLWSVVVVLIAGLSQAAADVAPAMVMFWMPIGMLLAIPFRGRPEVVGTANEGPS